MPYDYYDYEGSGYYDHYGTTAMTTSAVVPSGESEYSSVMHLKRDCIRRQSNKNKFTSFLGNQYQTEEAQNVYIKSHDNIV